MQYNLFIAFCFLTLCTQKCLGQLLDTDTTHINYAKELKLLKEQIHVLQQQVDNNQKLNSKKFNLIERSKLSSFAVYRVGELDWSQYIYNPETQQGQREHSRFWARILANVYLDTKITDKLDYRFSIQVFPGFAFGGESDARLAILLDEIWLKYKFNGNQSIKIGRQDASEIWSNQIGTQFDFWRHDGISYQYKHITNTELVFTGKSAFYIESYRNNQTFKNQGKLYGFSLNLEKNNAYKGIDFSTGIIKANALANRFKSDLQNDYWDGDLATNYTIWATEFVYNFKHLNNLTFKTDIYHNFKNYNKGMRSNLITDATGRNSFETGFDKTTAPNFTNQRSGIYTSVKTDLPFISKKLSLSLAYLYMEKYAALDVFAQFDLARWTSTNVKGWEFVFLYKYNDKISFRNRTFFMEEIRGLHGSNPDFRRSGNRTRFDIIINI